MWGPIESVLIREVSGEIIIHVYIALGQSEVSTYVKCPDFRVSTFRGSTVECLQV